MFVVVVVIVVGVVVVAVAVAVVVGPTLTRLPAPSAASAAADAAADGVLNHCRRDLGEPTASHANGMAAKGQTATNARRPTEATSNPKRKEASRSRFKQTARLATNSQEVAEQNPPALVNAALNV